MRLRRNVKLHKIKPELLCALLVVERVYFEYGEKLTINEVNKTKLCLCRPTDFITSDSLIHTIRNRLTAEFEIFQNENCIFLNYTPKKRRQLMKAIKSKLLIILIIPFLISCAGFVDGVPWTTNIGNILPQPKDSICTTIPPGESDICAMIRKPESINFLIKFSNALALDSNAYNVPAVSKIVDKAIVYVQSEDPIWDILYERYLDELGMVTGVVVSEYKVKFVGGLNPIKQRDREMIVENLKYHRNLMQIVMNRGV